MVIDHYSKFDVLKAQNSLGVIISGSSLNVSDFYYNERLRHLFVPQLDFIKNPNATPILGICFGFHLISYAYDAQICRMRIPGLGSRMIFIILDKTDNLITKKNIPVDAHHRDFISPNDMKIHESFEVLSTTHTMRYKIIEYIKHKTKPIYGLQFHPETHNAFYFRSDIYDEKIVDRTRVSGEEILKNFVYFCLYEQQKEETQKINK